MACHISFRDVAFQPFAASVTITVITREPCHLWCRLSLQPPRIHKKAVARRGEYFMSELRFCFTVYEDNEQDEPGDTLTHTWVKPAWPPCTTKYFYLWGSISGVTCVSTSPPFRYHNDYEAPSWVETILYLGVPTDSFSFFNYSGSWLWRCPFGSVYVGWDNSTWRWGGGGFRFINCPLAPTSNVIEARLFLRAYGTETADPCRSRIQVEDNVSPATFSTYSDYFARSQLVPAIDWDDIEHWYVPLRYYGVDFSQLLNALIIKPGWSAGNPIAVSWHDWAMRTPAGSLACRRTHGGLTSPITSGPQLYLKYTP